MNQAAPDGGAGGAQQNPYALLVDPELIRRIANKIDAAADTLDTDVDFQATTVSPAAFTTLPPGAQLASAQEAAHGRADKLNKKAVSDLRAYANSLRDSLTAVEGADQQAEVNFDRIVNAYQGDWT